MIGIRFSYRGVGGYMCLKLHRNYKTLFTEEFREWNFVWKFVPNRDVISSPHTSSCMHFLNKCFLFFLQEQLEFFLRVLWKRCKFKKKKTLQESILCDDLTSSLSQIRISWRNLVHLSRVYLRYLCWRYPCTNKEWTNFLYEQINPYVQG